MWTGEGVIIGIRFKNGILLACDSEPDGSSKIYKVVNNIFIAGVGWTERLKFHRYQLAHSDITNLGQVERHLQRICKEDTLRMSIRLHEYGEHSMTHMLAGFDGAGYPLLQVIDEDGMHREAYFAMGTGGDAAMWYLKENYKMNCHAAVAKELAAKALECATTRDDRTGGTSICFLTSLEVTGTGFKSLDSFTYHQVIQNATPYQFSDFMVFSYQQEENEGDFDLDYEDYQRCPRREQIARNHNYHQKQDSQLQDLRAVPCPMVIQTLQQLTQRYVRLPVGKKLEVIHRWLCELELHKVVPVIFANTPVQCGTLARELEALMVENYTVFTILGDNTPQQRQATFEAFVLTRNAILVTQIANVADLDCVRTMKAHTAVFNYNMPEDSDAYAHRVCGICSVAMQSIAITFVSTDDEMRRLQEVRFRFAVYIPAVMGEKSSIKELTDSWK